MSAALASLRLKPPDSLFAMQAGFQLEKLESLHYQREGQAARALVRAPLGAGLHHDVEAPVDSAFLLTLGEPGRVPRQP
jgi:hypothetical protein